MKFILAPDKFKDSLTGLEFCEAVNEGILSEIPNAEINFVPLSDGGDGTIEVVQYYLGSNIEHCSVQDPLFRSIKASYLLELNTSTAFIEMAEASGLKLLTIEERNCMITSSYGTGEMIIDAINNGATKVFLAIGGSATNDCGIGMAAALGYQFLDEEGNVLKPIGENLLAISRVDSSNLDPRIKAIDFKIVSDVSNLLYGINGAAYVYAAQKGASSEDIRILDNGLRSFSKVLNTHFDITSHDVIGGGASGGLGVGAFAFLNGKIISGIEFIKSLSNFDAKSKNADWIITGEGKLDTQTLSGKVIYGVSQTAIRQQIKVAAFCGISELSKTALNDLGITYVDAIMNRTNDNQMAMKKSYAFVREMAADFARSIIS